MLPLIRALVTSMVVLVLTAGCGSDPSELAIELRGIDLDLRLAALDEIAVEVVDDVTGERVVAGSAAGAQLDQGPRLFDADRLEVGRRYRIRVRVDVQEPCTARGRAVGRSLPFEFGGGDQTVVIPIGCAEQLIRPNAGPSARRIGHEVVRVPGGAFVIGGAERFDALATFPEPSVRDLVPSVERYDLHEGTFAEFGALIDPRAAPAIAPLPPTTLGDDEGVFAIIAGTVDIAPGCLEDVERFASLAGRVGPPLSFPRCTAAAAATPRTGHVVLAGGRVRPRDAPFLVLSPELDGDVVVPTGASGVVRRSPRLLGMADRTSVLVVGGVSPTLAIPSPPVAELVRVEGCDDGDGPCVEDVRVEGLPGDGLVDPTATWMACPAGGGAVIVTGGRSRIGLVAEALDRVWCHRDRGDGQPVVLTPAGRLDRPRSGHVAVGVTEPVPRLLIIGGAGGPADPVVSLDVDPCGCGAAVPTDRSVPLVVPWAGEPTGARAAVLDDGSVLLVGGAARATDETVFDATGEAALFFPDLPLELEVP